MFVDGKSWWTWLKPLLWASGIESMGLPVSPMPNGTFSLGWNGLTLGQLGMADVMISIDNVCGNIFSVLVKQLWGHSLRPSLTTVTRLVMS